MLNSLKLNCDLAGPQPKDDDVLSGVHRPHHHHHCHWLGNLLQGEEVNLTLWALSLQVVPNLSLDERDAERGQKNERQGREWEEGWESTKRDIRFDFLFKFSPAIHDDVGSNPRVVSGYLSVHRRQLPGPPTLLPMSPLQIIPFLLFGEFADQESVEAFRVRIFTSWKVSADEKRKYMVCMQHII